MIESETHHGGATDAEDIASGLAEAGVADVFTLLARDADHGSGEVGDGVGREDESPERKDLEMFIDWEMGEGNTELRGECVGDGRQRRVGAGVGGRCVYEFCCRWF